MKQIRLCRVFLQQNPKKKNRNKFENDFQYKPAKFTIAAATEIQLIDALRILFNVSTISSVILWKQRLNQVCLQSNLSIKKYLKNWTPPLLREGKKSFYLRLLRGPEVVSALRFDDVRPPATKNHSVQPSIQQKLTFLRMFSQAMF